MKTLGKLALACAALVLLGAPACCKKCGEKKECKTCVKKEKCGCREKSCESKPCKTCHTKKSCKSCE